ncbi:hypothetical protein FACS1894205_4570 [Alphaproteobacteria bacterium]|nr:hypothetical protein FACS1894205_4570 [Alphaproteobacteria bacterium]
MRNFFLSAASLMFFSASASAAVNGPTMPDYDVKKFCSGVVRTAGGGQAVLNSCYKQEQEAYNRLKRTWNATPAATRSLCGDVSIVAGKSYTILDSCIEQEQRTAAENSRSGPKK